MLTVRQYQTNLKHYYAYYTKAVDGINGAGTKAAVKAFQRDHGLVVDGIYGAKTDAKLVACIKSLQGKEPNGELHLAYEYKQKAKHDLENYERRRAAK